MQISFFLFQENEVESKMDDKKDVELLLGSIEALSQIILAIKPEHSCLDLAIENTKNMKMQTISPYNQQNIKSSALSLLNKIKSELPK